MKILYVTTIGTTMGFFKSFIKKLSDDGNQVELACNNTANVPEFYVENGFKIHSIDCSRAPINKGNFKAVNQLKKIVENGHFDIVHCHTPIAAACCRIACRKVRKNGTKVIYTAHGFHFYKGAPFINWLVYYPIEKICSHFTDVLITINTEDYALAQKKMKAKSIQYVPGVGIDTEKFTNCTLSSDEKNSLRKEMDVPFDAKLLVSVGELNENKNHQVVLKAISMLNDSNIHYAVAGRGNKSDDLTELAKKLGISDQSHLLGYRNDIAQIYKSADICCFPSIREGLGLAAIEGMAAGLPLIAADNRGTRDFCQNGVNGFMCDPFSPQDFADAISKLLNDNCLCARMGNQNTNDVKKFYINIVNNQMLEIYNELSRKEN